MSNWNTLEDLHAKAADRKIIDLFDDADRFDNFTASLGDMVLDYSKTNIDADIRDALVSLAEDAGVAAYRDNMFSGKKINETEGRAVLHTALRNLTGTPVEVDGADVMPGVLETLGQMKEFAEGVRSGKIVAADGKPFTDVVNIGIGGSDLGPVMATLALAPYHDGPATHFVSNVDGAHVHDVLAPLDPARTLLIIASKTFTTQETMANAASAQKWLVEAMGKEAADKHLAALSTSAELTAAFGVAPDRVFGFEDWVGGRYSMWGPIGLSVLLAIGSDDFIEFLSGAEEMDIHFKTAPFAENLPVLLGLIGVWHSNICGYDTRAVLPYDQRLLRLPAYLQQLDMESNGKGVDMDGKTLPRGSGPIVWGEPGTNGQHAFYQLIHQGTRVVPCEFMIAKTGHEDDLAHQHTLLQSNCLAQAEALMVGRSMDEARALMEAKGFTGAELEKQASHRVFEGNRPSTTLVYEKLTPRTFGKIVALYEHRVFVEGVIWGINSFDQWGVELGKELANKLIPLLKGEGDASGKDGSTAGLLAYLKG